MSSSRIYTPDLLVTPEVLADPYPAYRQLRPVSPVQYPYLPAGVAPGSSGPALSWALLRYEDVYGALRDHETFSSERNLVMGIGRYQRLLLLYDDPPRHTRFRRLVSYAFTTRRIEALEPWIRELAYGLLDEIGGGETDIMSSLAAPLPVMVIARLIGIPPGEYQTFRRWSEALLAVVGMPKEERLRNIREMMAYFGKMALERRAQGAEDLISALVTAKIEGEALEDWEILGFCILLLIGGNETTMNLIGNMLNVLAGRPELWQRLREDRSLISAVIDETLRFDSPIQRLFRRTTRDVEIAGVRIPEGDLVSVFYGAANRDPEAFEDPDTFRPERDLRKHVGFGAGIHYCLGALLARTEASIVLNAMLDRYPEIHPGDVPAVRQTNSLPAAGFQRLPLRIHA